MDNIMNEETITALLAKQRTFFATQATKNVEFRIEALKRLKKAIISNEATLNDAIWADLHKSAYEFYLTEISLVLQEIDNHIRNLRKWSKPEHVHTPLTLFPSKSYVVHEPFGVVLIIAPWNYPFQLLINPLIGAVSAGNCAVLKSSPYAPRTSAVMKQIVSSAFNEEYVAYTEGGREVNQLLLAQRFDYIFFTGSASLGRIVMAAAAKNLTPLTLELGGKSPCIVDKDAAIDVAAKRIAWGKLINAGQTCIGVDYLFVHKAVKVKLIESIKRYIKLFYGDNPESSEDFPRIVNDKAMERLAALMTEGNIIEGGELRRDERYIAPTLIDDVKPDFPIMQEEIFGPLLPIMEFTDIQTVIDYINNHEKPLALYFFGGKKEAKRVVAATTSGGACINDTLLHIANHHLPFGGVGNSGMGKYHGRYSFDTFSNKRALFVSKTWFDIFLKYAPYKGLKFLKKIM